MIEFTLSKINLLILVVALFSIISFFSLNVGKIFLVNEVKQEMDKYALTLNSMLVAPTTCDSKPFAIPPKFTSFGNNIYYRMFISTTSDPSGSRLIFAVSDIRTPTSVLAASSLATDSKIVIIDQDNENGFQILPSNDPNAFLELDPQDVPPRNAFYAVKSVKAGLPTLYIFPCSITAQGQNCSGKGYIKEQVNDFLPKEEQFIC
ncbi:MAG: hypothetical protein AABX02_03990 [archaeon]